MFIKANNKALCILSIIFTLCMTGLFTACSAKSQHNMKLQSSAKPQSSEITQSSIKSQLNLKSQSSTKLQPEVKTRSNTDFVTIQTDSFSLEVPTSWKTKTKPEVTFNMDKTSIGGVSVIGYDPETQSVTLLYGNQAEVISQKKRNDLSLPTLEVILRRTSPAAASEQTSVNELHYYFINKNKKIAYDLNFNSQKVSKETSEKIAKSFHVKT